MYPITCHAGFPLPVASGKFEVLGLCVAINDTTADSQIVLVDDPDIDQETIVGRLLTTLEGQKGILVNMKGLANADATLEHSFEEPIKVRNGLSIYGTNLVPGSICVYRR